MEEETPTRQAVASHGPRTKLTDLTVGGKWLGTVKRFVADLGLFLDIGAESDGLLHLSEIPNGKGAAKMFKIGDVLTVYIRDINWKKGRLSFLKKGRLSLRFRQKDTQEWPKKQQRPVELSLLERLQQGTAPPSRRVRLVEDVISLDALSTPEPRGQKLHPDPEFLPWSTLQKLPPVDLELRRFCLEFGRGCKDERPCPFGDSCHLLHQCGVLKLDGSLCRENHTPAEHPEPHLGCPEDRWKEALRNLPFAEPVQKARELTPTELFLSQAFSERPNSGSQVLVNVAKSPTKVSKKTLVKRGFHFLSRNRARAPVGAISDETIRACQNKAMQIAMSGKTLATLRNYQAASEDWTEFAQARNWGWRLDTVPLPERQRRVILWLCFEMTRGLNKASSAQKKIDALRWKHTSYPTLALNPFDGADGLKDWIKDWGRTDGPTRQSLPASLDLLKGIFAQLDLDDIGHQSLKTALLTGFWFLMRSIEYLFSELRPGLTLNDLLFRVKDGNILSWVDIFKNPDLLLAAEELTVTVSCFKNKKVTSTRSLRRLPAESSDVCAVANLVTLIRMRLLDEKDSLDMNGSLFVRPRVNEEDPAQPWSGPHISQIIKAGANMAGLLGTMYGSHSVRRGGASQWAASGLSRDDLRRFGRWVSDACEEYIYESADRINEVAGMAANLHPRYERN
jgi:predicted RNA-binding protein with RPS1 domain